MYCPDCGTEIKDDAKFCPKCGSSVKENEQTENSVNISTDVKNKSKGILSFLDDWKEWGTGKKIISIIVACCIGLIIIGVIGGILFPDFNTSEHRYYMANSSFVIPDGCTISESEDEAYTAILIQKDGSELYVYSDYPQIFDSSQIIDSNETINVDGVIVNKIKYHYDDGLSFTDYYFNKDNINYYIYFNQEADTNDDVVTSIVKSMDTTHGSISDHENIYPGSTSSNNNNGHVDLYDSYHGTSGGEVNNVEVDKTELTADQYAYLAYDGTKDYTLNGQKGLLYVGPYHDGGSDVDFFYQKDGKYYMLTACDDSQKALEKMEGMV